MVGVGDEEVLGELGEIWVSWSCGVRKEEREVYRRYVWEGRVYGGHNDVV